MAWTVRPDGAVDFVNRRWLEYTGLSLEQEVEDPTGVIHPEDLQRVLKKWGVLMAAGEAYEDEMRLRRADGEYHWFLVRTAPQRDKNGNIIKWYGTSTDIEDRKQAEKKLEQLKDRLYKENLGLRAEIDSAAMFEVIGASQALEAVQARVAKVAPTDSTVLITGETGTGKELIARAIHKRSLRCSGPFVNVNCAAIPSSLIASELFGHEKGAFTGALQRRLGRFELAEGGTIFLDEIGELSAEVQVALLRVLQEREFERLGGNQTIRADVRVIAASNRDLQAAIAGGAFRSDLFYRLHVVPVEVPPLRERKEDIPLLVEYFMTRSARKAGKRIRGISNETLELLQSYPWPGNVRELQNVIERSVILSDTEDLSIDEMWLRRESLPPPVANQSLSKIPTSIARDMIEAALAETRGRVAGRLGAAAKLGISPSTLESKIRALKIDKGRFRGANTLHLDE